MTDTEKLVELLGKMVDFSDGTLYLMADYLVGKGVVLREKGEWKHCFIYTGNGLDNYMQRMDGWECSECGYATLEKFDFCTCGADMRKGENNG